MNKKTLIIIAGPTAVGKTSLAIELAQKLNCEIISADSRQFYKEMKIGVAAPSDEELAMAKHHFIGNLSIQDYYNVSIFEQQALEKINELFLKDDFVIAVGGSGLYIQALMHGIDEMPDVDEKLRDEIKQKYAELGLEFLQNEVEKLDPEYFEIADINNPKRLMRALEVIKQTGEKYSKIRTNSKKNRGFEIKAFVLNMERQKLYERINRRVDLMVEQGLIQEAEFLYKFRDLNALNTVGYKELFKYFDGDWSKDLAIEKIKTKSRRFSKRQITWFKRDKSFEWIERDDLEKFENLRI
jgi:tRNA dimethylallyltransferase